MDCPSIDQIFDYAQDRSADAEAGHVGLHLSAGCLICRGRFSTLQKVIKVTATRRMETPPTWLLRQALNLIDRKAAAAKRGMVERLVGLLVVDSFAEGRLLGVRGGGPNTRHMLYRAGGYEIDLSIDFLEPSNTVEIIGQSMPPDGVTSSVAGSGVELVSGETIAASTHMNDFGEFILDGVSEGTYDLRISFPNAEVDIASLQAMASFPEAPPAQR